MDSLRRCVEVADGVRRGGILEELQRCLDDTALTRRVSHRANRAPHEVWRHENSRHPQLQCAVAECLDEHAHRRNPCGLECSRDESDRPVADRSGRDEKRRVHLACRHVLRPPRGGLIAQAGLRRGAGECVVLVCEAHTPSGFEVA